MPATPEAIRLSGHAIEARLYAEDPAQDYRPSAGPLALLHFPAPSHTLRVETGFRQGDRVSPYYDALIAKLIAWGETREIALERLRQALAETQVAGIVSNRELLQRILAHPDFAARAGDTGFIARHHDALLPPADVPLTALAAAALSLLRENTRPSADAHSPWQRRDGWRLGHAASDMFRFRAGERAYELRISYLPNGYRCESDGQSLEIAGGTSDGAAVRLGNEFWVVLPDATYRLTYLDPLAPGEQTEASAGKIVAPMPGKVSAVLVAPGATVQRGQTLMLIEAMKMEHAITAPSDGVVDAINFAPGALVEEGVELLRLKGTP